MPTISPNAKVLVTGANGFLAVWVVKTFLDRGYHVIGTVRSESKGTHLKKIFKDAGDRFQLAVVSDITAEGAFDELVKDVDAIAHTASPFHFSSEDPQDFLDPAINGTVGVLKSAIKYGKRVKRVVITSSVAAVQQNVSEPKVFTEVDWNEQAVDDVQKNGKSAQNPNKYMASKTLAERAAWDLLEKHKSEVSFDLTTIQPPYIFGPVLQEVPQPSELNTSSKMLYDCFQPSSSLTAEELVSPQGSYADVRDVALAHVLSLEKEAAGGQRIIISADTWTYQDFLDAANSLSPQPLKRDIPKGMNGLGKGKLPNIRFDNSKMKKVLGLEPTSIEELTRGMLESYAERGW
jgi:nucleoside-diphosphate-sugar epimerase